MTSENIIGKLWSLYYYCINLVKCKHISANPLLYMGPGQNWLNTKPAQDLEGRSEARAITPDDSQLNVVKQKQRCRQVPVILPSLL